MQEVNAQIKSSIKNMKCLAAVAPFAAVGGSTNTFILITKAVGSFIKVRIASGTCMSFQTSRALPVCFSRLHVCTAVGMHPVQQTPFLHAAVPAPSVSAGAAELVSSFWMGQATMACSAPGIERDPSSMLCVANHCYPHDRRSILSTESLGCIADSQT